MTGTNKAAAGGAVLAVAIGAAVLMDQQTAPVPVWPMLRVEWNAVPCHGYNVYHGTNLDRRTWTKMGSTTNTSFWFRSSQFGFVGVKAFYLSGTNELESAWATSKM
jgi:hypothetical protein